MRSSDDIERSIFGRRAFVLGMVGAAGWATLIARLANLQLFERETYQEGAVQNTFNFDLTPAPRGIIYDRFGVPMAVNRRDFRLIVAAVDKPKLDQVSEAGARFAQRIGLDPAETQAFLTLLKPTKDATEQQRAEAVAALTVRLSTSRRGVDLMKKLGIAEFRRRGLRTHLEAIDGVTAVLPFDPQRAWSLVEGAVALDRPSDPLLISDLSWEEFSTVNVYLPEIPNVRAEAGQVRAYPRGPLFSHIVGYVQKANAEEAKDDRLLKHPAMRIGKSGIEEGAEDVLRGVAGQRARIVNAAGREIALPPESPLYDDLLRLTREPIQGQDVILTLDAELQEFAARRLGDNSGSAVVMDIYNGDLIVCASTPGFDPNHFVNGIGVEEYRELLNNDHKPLYHKAVKGIYPPGSTFKMITALAGLKTGLMDPKERVPCNGYYPFGSRVFHCWKRGGHGPQDLHGGIKNSCDCYFYEVARRTGPDAIADVARAFGFGQSFDIGISDVSKGLVPDSAWKLKRRKAPWNPGESLSYGIGQGFLIVTPLQLAVMSARIANNGRAVYPRLYRERGHVASAEPKPPVSMGVDATSLKLVQEGMWAVCNEPGGTAIVSGQINIPGVQIAGKTGTAQVRNISAGERAGGVISNDNLPWAMRDHALFVCYAPYDNPRYACSVVVDHGGGGSKVAGPIARDIMHEVLIKNPSAMPAFTRIASSASGAKKESKA